MSSSRPAQRGFTLIELLMATAVLSVLLAIAAPAYGKLIGRTHGQAARNDLNATLNTARIAAVTRRNHVVVCPSDDLAACTRTTHWHQGWLIFVDVDHDGARGADEPIVSVGNPQPAGVAITTTGGRLRVDYKPDGRADGSNATLTVCDRAGGAEAARSLVINQAGRVRTAISTPEAAAECLRVAG